MKSTPAVDPTARALERLEAGIWDPTDRSVLPALIKVSVVAGALQKSERYVYAAVAADTFPFPVVRVGRHMKFRSAELVAFLEGRDDA